MSLFNDRSQMTSKCSKNKKETHEAIADCLTDVRTTFWRLLRSITEQTQGQYGIYLLYTMSYNNETNYYRQRFFNYKIFRHNANAGLCPRPPWQTPKKPFDVICYLYKMKQSRSLVAMRSEELWLVQENHATVKPDSSATPGGMKTYTAKAE